MTEQSRAAKADDKVFIKAKEKIGKAIDALPDSDVTNLVKLCETLAKMKVAESKGKDDDWGGGLNPT